MTTHQLRETYLSFFQRHRHAIVPSASLIPENDPTTLFTGSGMQPMIAYLFGEPHPQGKRVADSQRCFRSGDIDEVGDSRHTTFFEMLGNWSFGDYFKLEQIEWMYAFLTKELGLDPSRLYVTCFAGKGEEGIPRDDEAAQKWKEHFLADGIEAQISDAPTLGRKPDERIFFYGEEKNWWSRVGVTSHMPVGEPGGPDSEIFWDFDPSGKMGLHEASAFSDTPCHVNCDCGRYLEIGNNVFMQYKKTSDGFEPLPAKNIDFGGGLERMQAALIDSPDVFMIDVFEQAKATLERLSGKMYLTDTKTTHAYRVILDHLRAATFLIADGALPSNKDQGYFTRRLVRRAVRYGGVLGIREVFATAVAEAFIDAYAPAFPWLNEKRHFILGELQREEERFRKTLERGLKEFEKLFSKKTALSGEDAFVLYSTYGFPLELTEELAQEKGQRVDRVRFQKEFQQHQELSRAGAKEKFAGGLADHSEQTVRLHTATHLLHQALRRVLGPHVEQRGSNITQDRLRFDFSHTEKMTEEQKAQVERIVNEVIGEDLPVHFEMLDFEEAKRRGAIGLFEDKYAQLGNRVKVYFVGKGGEEGYFSSEVCGGPHVELTGELGSFSLIKEESVSAGIRRIKAVVGRSKKAE